MKVEFEVNSTPNPLGRYLTWSPSPCRIRVSDPSGISGNSVTLKISSKTAGATGGSLVFRKTTSGAFSASINLTVPKSGESVPFQAAGKYPQASNRDGDVQIEAHNGTTLVGSVPVMVRIRKNANELTAEERERFLSAFAQLNAKGLGRFTDFREMHTSTSSPQAHGAAGFLPWHRIYILDLERELQEIDPSVALPYWRFDQPAPKLFKKNYLGEADPVTGAVHFDSANPLQFWTTDGVQGFMRRPRFNTNTQSANVIDETATLNLGNDYDAFIDMEGDPHGYAHTSFMGPISSVPTAARDPLFFLLHCNVDRLWAKWQRKNDRYDPDSPEAYSTSPQPINHNLTDSLWPWNGVTGSGRPPTAPGGALASSLAVSAPGPMPLVLNTLDYQGNLSNLDRFGYDYDDVEFA
ncbi:Tyrosinase [Gimesia panareensis]|uniref:Tyrosinase n=1 Tax=Gimesia panareensis TaxID=2527978 RepID=A0A518FGN9_9PLAN|nr:tyrosinase family protein [Gimesia panareensis]QDV15470.1 Tyrosinase [Gimesia panareensis]